MPVSFTCPHCGAKTEVAESFVGQTGPCSACGKMVTITPPVSPGAPAPGKGSGAALAIVAMLVVGGCCVLGLLGLGASFFWVRLSPVMQSAPAAPQPPMVPMEPPEPDQPAELPDAP